MEATGIALRIGATLFFTVMVVFVKLLADEVPLGQVVFFRSAVALIPLVLFLMWTRDFPSGLRTKRPLSHIARCLLGCTALFASFASLKYLPLAHASIIGYLAPVLAVVLARFLLGEQVNGMRWFAVVLGFLGMLVLVLPGLTAATPDQPYLIGAGLAFAMAIFTAGAKIQIRSLAQTENAGAIAFYFALTCAVAGGVSVFWGWVQPDFLQLVYLCGAGIAGGIAHIMMTLALQHSEISKLAPFEYLSLIFAVLADFMLFRLVPDGAFYLSTLMILAAMWAITFKDRAKGRSPGREPSKQM
ncbi:MULTISPECIES: DMT family transporter [unclassified Leisingera]|uniref:DMT family transporter n=1 Tax=unclassified Leisingera TaxID=2614906 RepID=UPI00031B80C2|nr:MULTISPECIES: DMT family transporter [unclassified Leisingera]KIC15456.1 membrane protein [Leisingera sp. ANG-DT]KIC23555.1 membrane protein [Leisingera sp. ANG-S3]KIC28069.1 membrane protein [Leisingera sp. ANG-M6]KIC32197.1 membrane protein [Leisingera sp. ANG-S5]KIC54049.1 membrane protein [Leisingera sp. ANG-S]